MCSSKQPPVHAVRQLSHPLQEFHDILRYERFAVKVPYERITDLPQILDAYTVCRAASDTIASPQTPTSYSLLHPTACTLQIRLIETRKSKNT